MASSAASRPRHSLFDTPVPMMASPISLMTERTSLKSTLTMPGTLMISEMPFVALRSTSSAILNASVNGMVRSAMERSFWFGTTMRVSTISFRALSPLLAEF